MEAHLAPAMRSLRDSTSRRSLETSRPRYQEEAKILYTSARPRCSCACSGSSLSKLPSWNGAYHPPS